MATINLSLKTKNKKENAEEVIWWFDEISRATVTGLKMTTMFFKSENREGEI